MLLSTNSIGADKYNVGDNLWVWAKNGLNLRNGPGTNFKVIGKLGFGEELLVTEKSEKAYNIMGISDTRSNYHSKKVDPLIFRGKWVKVKSQSGEEGFLIDQYLLSVQPKEINKPQYDINLDLSRVDTVYKSPIIQDGSGLNITIEKTYLDDIKLIESSGGYWAESTYIFPDYSVEEVLILLSSSWSDYERFTILRNWKEELILTDNELCQIRITIKENKVQIVLSCSC